MECTFHSDFLMMVALSDSHPLAVAQRESLELEDNLFNSIPFFKSHLSRHDF